MNMKYNTAKFALCTVLLSCWNIAVNAALKIELLSNSSSLLPNVTAPVPDCFVIAAGIDAVLRVTNTGGGNLTGIQALINPTYTANVAVTNTCPDALAANAFCTIQLVHQGVYGGPLTCEINHVVAQPNSDVIFKMAVSG